MIKSTTLSPPISIHALVKRATEVPQTQSSSGFISIHALVKRATLVSVKSSVRVSISIHALVKRATCDILTNSGATVFQSTPS